MPRHGGGGGGRSGNRASGGNTRRLRRRKNTYAPKQHHASAYWEPYQTGTAVAAVAAPDRHRLVDPLGAPDRRVRMGRKNRPAPTQKPQKPKRPKGGSK